MNGADAALIAALAAGRTQAEAAADAGVSVRTVARRVAEPAFIRQVADARAALLDRALGRLVSHLDAATDVFGALLSAADERVRLRAALAVIDETLRLHEARDVDERLRRLEAAADARGER